MCKANPRRLAAAILFTALATLSGRPAFGQPARPQNPPDITGEWRLESDEDPGALGGLGQPPLRYIINTNDSAEHIGGNEKFATSGFYPRGGGLGGATGVGRTASIVAHESVATRMTATAGKPGAIPEKAWPTDTYFDEFYKLPEYFNGEAVIVYHEPAANTDADSVVFFRHSEVISAGNIFSTVSYPAIDLEKGGSINGVIKGLNHILDLAVAEYRSQGGTWIIPSHGRFRIPATLHRTGTCSS